MSLRPIAIHLPQFHPIPENDEWWGRGFTEWTNVVRGVPLFEGHYQPHLPADMGFYDLRLPEARAAQAELARAHGIHGFCYYHYWFHGRRLLERPVHGILEQGEPDFPFCLCWANEAWSRNWDGKNHAVLMPQRYSMEDHMEHIRYLLPIFADERYIKVDGKPVFAFYKPEDIPEIERVAELWRAEARAYGFPDLYLINVERRHEGVDPATYGFDAALAFHPNLKRMPRSLKASAWEQFLNRFREKPDPITRNRVFYYKDYIERAKQQPEAAYKRFPGLTPGWDNSPRRRDIKCTILLEATPELFEGWLRHIYDTFTPYSAEENFVFINAWNEWAEGNHLEPCQKWGRGFLEAVQRVARTKAPVETGAT